MPLSVNWFTLNVTIMFLLKQIVRIKFQNKYI